MTEWIYVEKLYTESGFERMIVVNTTEIATQNKSKIYLKSLLSIVKFFMCYSIL